jgi:small-conductance mechanosensitive channel
VDIALSPESPVDKSLAALEAAAGDLRGDNAWSQALVDGPRILGVQNIDRSAATVRLQVRTAPTRQDEVARELRRRIQLEFQKQGIPMSSVQRFEFAHGIGGLVNSNANGTNTSGADSLASPSQSGVAGPLEPQP